MSVYVIEVFNAASQDQYKYVAYDAHSGGYPYLTNGMFCAARHKTFDEARNEYQRMVTATMTKMSDGAFSLPYMLRSAGEITGNVGKTDATVTVAILEISGVTWPTIKVERLVQHTVILHEDKRDATIQVVDAEPAKPQVYCPEKQKPGGCQLHNLQCGWPKCNVPK